jgi:tape measure domain-containing protein
MTRNIEAFKLKTVLDLDNAKYAAVMKASEKDLDKLGARFTKLGPEITKSMKGAELGTKFGQQFSSSATSLITGSFSSLGQTLGSLLGTVMLPGVGTAIGSTIGSAADTALAKISGPIMQTITAGIELNKVLESTRVEFTSLTGSEKEAVKYLNELLTLSKQTGILPTNLIEASESLYDLTGNLKLTNLLLRASIDQAADIGGGPENIRKIADALGLVAEKGELTAQTLRALWKLKINAPQLLAEGFGVSEKKIRELMAQGRIRGEVAAQVIAEGLQRKNAGFAAKLASTTTQGAENVFAARKTILGAQGTENITQEYKKILQDANEIMGSPAAQQFVQFINTTSGTVINMVEKGVATGVNLSKGLATGIENGAPGVINAITNVGTSAIDTLTDLWGMRSPSRVFAQMGSYAVDGLENGLVDRTAQGFDRWAEALEKAGGEAFIRGVAGIAKRIGVDPAWLLNVMAFESSFNAKAANPHSSGRGLIQFMDPTARALGFSSSSQITGLSAKQQLPLVEQYFKPFAGKMKNQGDVYAAVAAGRLPGASGVLFRKGSKEYAANKIWDANRDDVITAEEIGKLASRKGGFSSKAGPGNSDWSVRAVAQVMDMAGQMTQLTADGRPVTAANPLPVKIQNVNDLIKNTNDLVLSTSKIALGEGDPITHTQAAIEAATKVAISLPQVSTAAALAAESMPPVVAGMEALGKEIPLTKEELRRLGFVVVDTIGRFAGAIGQIGGMLPQETVGKKRGLFSKILGFAAPFLSFVPGVGPVLSQIAGMASNALGGNWAGVASGLSGGLQPGGVFRSSGGGSSGGGSIGTRGMARGGPVRRGRSYLVGEYRPEMFVPESDGWIHPRVGAQGGGGDAMTAQLIAALDRQNAFLARLESMKPHEVVRLGAPGLMDAMDQNAGITLKMGRRLRLP